MGAPRVQPPGVLTAAGRCSEVRLTGLLTRVVAVTLISMTILACTQTAGTVIGVITSVEGTIDEVTAFTVFTEGAELEFVPVEGGDYGFPLSHLREHQRTGDPVLVEWELVGTVRQALSLADG